MTPRHFTWRRIQASWRDTRLLFRQFRWPLLVFCAVIIGGGFLYASLFDYCVESNVSITVCGEPVDNLLEAFYIVLILTFFQSSGGFPGVLYLEAFYFVMPVIGLIVLAQGVADFGVTLFNRRSRSKEWEMAVASTFSHHIIIIGLGHLGYRVVQDLIQLEQDVVVVEKDPKIDLVSQVKSLGIPVLQEDGNREATLEAAGIRQAQAIILCSQNDVMNLQIALRARSLNPKIRVIIRIFDDDFAASLQEQFGFTAMSATRMAAPAFAAASAGVDVTQPIVVEGQALSLAKMMIQDGSQLLNRAVGDIEQQFSVSIVLIKNTQQTDLHPDVDRRLQSGDNIAILGGPKEIQKVLRSNRIISGAATINR